MASPKLATEQHGNIWNSRRSMKRPYGTRVRLAMPRVGSRDEIVNNTTAQLVGYGIAAAAIIYLLKD